MIDLLWAALLAVVMVAMVGLTLLAFPHFALFVIPVALALFIPFLLVLGPVALLFSLPVYLASSAIKDVRAWRVRHQLRVAQSRLGYVSLDELLQ